MVAAIGSWLDAKSNQGEWRVRVDDIDPPRVVSGAAVDILHTLEAYGLEWDGPVMYQSERLDRYQEVLNTLITSGDAFPCSCTRKDLATFDVYPGNCRHRTGSEGRSWRLRAGKGLAQWKDHGAGQQSMDVASELGDFLLKGGHGVFSYHLSNVVDDGDMRISHVVRGMDLLPVSGCHVLLQHRLGYAPIQYCHLPLMTNEAGEKLSKQTHAMPVEIADASVVIHVVLEHLGCPGIALDTPRRMLAEALARWEIK